MPSKRNCTEATFLHDIREHQMSILMDNDIYRHLRFRRQGDSSYWFDLITWPGRLCITGDMGTYVFNRLEDMFEFFRTDREHSRYDQNGLSINPSYWSEKVDAQDKNAGVLEFDSQTFRDEIKRLFDEWVDENQPKEGVAINDMDAFKEQKDELWIDIDVYVLSEADNGEDAAYRAAMDFSSSAADLTFNDFYEVSCREYTFHYLWCCYAIAWGVLQYDNQKQQIS